MVKKVLQQFWLTAKVKQETDKTDPSDEDSITMEEEYNMADDVKLILPAIENVLIKMGQVRKDMPLRDDLSFDLSIIKAEVNDVKELLSAHPVPEPSFPAVDRLSLDQVLELDLLQTQSLDKLEQRLDIIAKSLDDLTSPSEASTEVIDTITSREAKVVAEAEENDEAIRVDAEDEDLPITSAANVGDKEDEDEDEDDDDELGDPLSFPDAGKYLGDVDDEDDDDDDFTIQYHTKPAAAQKGVSLKKSSSQGEKNKKKDTFAKNHNTFYKDKGVAEEGNLNVIFKPINP
ncbi:uncharacterized protein LOC112501735 [Cynara cardunculus var. scolymus]|uniref:uncharacterized protein LOC112501735 n=1 Tax=Cynara cardunculus var. scolymus TaxID=59895 RepID=UPI000D62708F|nr:uncharacterized protein LOC112501735 [Cynara cardunculus var. scolymus]